MGIQAKLLNIQVNLNAPKGQYNSFGKYNYRSAEDILTAIKPLLNETKTTLTITDSIENIGDRYYIKATARLTDTETGEYIDNVAFARESETKTGMDDAQLTGSCSSYARKYAMNGLFCIDDNKDPDTDNFAQQTNRNYTPAPPKTYDGTFAKKRNASTTATAPKPANTQYDPTKVAPLSNTPSPQYGNDIPHVELNGKSRYGYLMDLVKDTIGLPKANKIILDKVTGGRFVKTNELTDKEFDLAIYHINKAMAVGQSQPQQNVLDVPPVGTSYNDIDFSNNDISYDDVSADNLF